MDLHIAPADESLSILGAGPEDLSPREADMISLITRGLSNQEIADELFVSLNSVKTYIRGAYRKIGARSRSQAVIWGVRHGFLPDEKGLDAESA